MDVIPTALLSVLAGWLFAKTSHNVADHERLVVFRFGKYSGILEPGYSITLPFADTVRRVDLDRELPHWRSLSALEIRNAIEERLSLRL